MEKNSTTINECNYCLKRFSSLSVMTRHKKTSVQCLKLQNNGKVNYRFQCMYCEKGFTRKNTHLCHEDNCKYKMNNLLNEKVNKLEKDKAELLIEILNEKNKEKNSVRTTNVMINNNYNLVTFELSKADMKKQIKYKFTEDHLKNGQKGVAHFTFDNLIKNAEGKLMYYCSDTSRKKFVMKDKKGCIKKDHKATFLTNMIADDIQNKSEEIYTECINKIDPTGLKLISNRIARHYYNSILDIRSLKQCNTKFSSELSNLIGSVSNKQEEEEEEEEEQIIYVIEDSTDKEEEEEEEEEEEDLSKYTPEYFAHKEALIEKEYRENCMYKLFKKQLEEEKKKYLLTIQTNDLVQ